MTPYQRIEQLHADNIYKRGDFKGDAPMSERRKSHYRVCKRDGYYAVRFHNTDIITIDQETGNLTLDTCGWQDRPTTQQAMNEALRKLLTPRVYMQGIRFKGLSQLTLRTPAGSFLYYDGLSLSPDGALLTAPKTFKGKRVDREATAALRKGVEASGFKDMFRILWGSADVDNRFFRKGGTVREVITDPTRADEWQNLIAYYAQGMSRGRYTKRDADATWQSIMREAKKSMYTTITTEVTMI